MNNPEGSSRSFKGLVSSRPADLIRMNRQPGTGLGKVLLLLALLASVVGPAIPQIQQNTLMLELNAVISRLPLAEQLKPIPCSRTPADQPNG